MEGKGGGGGEGRETLIGWLPNLTYWGWEPKLQSKYVPQIGNQPFCVQGQHTNH